MKTSSVIRKFTVLLALSSLALTVMNCSKNDGDTATPVSQAQIVGSWKFTNVFIKEGNDAEVDQFVFLTTLLPCFKDIVIIFNADGTVAGTVPVACQSGVEDFAGDITKSRYEVKGDQLILTESDGTKTTMNVSFSGKTMSWLESETSGGVTTTTRIVLSKQ